MRHTCRIEDRAAPKIEIKPAMATARRRTCPLHPSSDIRVTATTFPHDSHNAAYLTTTNTLIFSLVAVNSACPPNMRESCLQNLAASAQLPAPPAPLAPAYSSRT